MRLDKPRIERALPWVSAIAAIVIAGMLIVISVQLTRIELFLADIDTNTR